MTAEIAVMNKDAIALAADSAVTIGTNVGNRVLEKVFTSANKIFSISKYEPMAAMIYGNATLMSIPWEAIIKLYRRELKQKRFPTAEEYAADLLRFLQHHKTLFPEDKCTPYFQHHLAAYFSMVREELLEGIPDPDALARPISLDAKKVQAILDRHAGTWRNSPFLQGASTKLLRPLKTRYRAPINAVIDHVFADISFTTKARHDLLEMGFYAIVKCPEELGWSSAAGLVVAGFGADDFFPALQSFAINGIFAGYLNYQAEKVTRIAFDNPVSVRPFAQADVVYAFMEGVDPGYQRTVEASTESLLHMYPEKVIDSCTFLDDATKAKLKAQFSVVVPQLKQIHFDALSRNRAENFSRPIVSLIEVLPKPELAALAESMVTLTALRRKVEAGVETVAGPIDVALISKGDGFIWIKRKHYFEPGLNHQFFANYYTRDTP